MASSGMIRLVTLVRTGVTEQPMHAVASYGYVPRSPILFTLIMEAPRYSETSLLARATRRNIPEDAIIHSHPREPQILHGS
jgi:hypothetical protein